MRKAGMLCAVMLCAGLLFSARPGYGEAAGPAEFYATNTMTMVTLFGPGGATDLAGRLVGKFWPEATGGGKYIVKNMPGAGGLVGLNSLSRTGKKDGTEFAFSMFGEAFLMPTLMKNPAARFDSSRFHYVAGGFQEPWVLVAHPKFKSLDDLKAAADPRYGCMTRYGSNNFTALPLFEMVLPQTRIVTGYQKQPDVDLAVGKGELDFAVAPLGNVLREMEQVELRPLVVFWNERLTQLPDVPVFTELVSMDEKQTAAYEDAVNMGRAFRVFVMMEDEPAEKVAYVRKILEDITSRPDFDTEVRRILPMGAAMLSSEELDRLVKECFAMNWEELKGRLDVFFK